MPRCSRCGLLKDTDQFYEVWATRTRRNKKTGKKYKLAPVLRHSNYCKPCQVEYQRERYWRQKNKEL